MGSVVARQARASAIGHRRRHRLGAVGHRTAAAYPHTGLACAGVVRVRARQCPGTERAVRGQRVRAPRLSAPRATGFPGGVPPPVDRIACLAEHAGLSVGRRRVTRRRFGRIACPGWSPLGSTARSQEKTHDSERAPRRQAAATVMPRGSGQRRRLSATRISSKLGGCLPRARHKRKSAW